MCRGVWSPLSYWQSSFRAAELAAMRAHMRSPCKPQLSAVSTPGWYLLSLSLSLSCKKHEQVGFTLLFYTSLTNLYMFTWCAFLFLTHNDTHPCTYSKKTARQPCLHCGWSQTEVASGFCYKERRRNTTLSHRSVGNKPHCVSTIHAAAHVLHLLQHQIRIFWYLPATGPFIHHSCAGAENVFMLQPMY